MNSKISGTLDSSRWSEGIVDYRENGLSIPFWTRPTHMAGSFVYIYAPFPEGWQEKYSWAADRKEEITTLAVDFIRSKFPPSIVKFESQNIILLRQADEETT